MARVWTWDIKLEQASPKLFTRCYKTQWLQLEIEPTPWLMPSFLAQSGSSDLIPTKCFKRVGWCLTPDEFWNNKEVSKDCGEKRKVVNELQADISPEHNNWMAVTRLRVNNVSNTNQKGLKKNYHANLIKKKEDIFWLWLSEIKVLV